MAQTLEQALARNKVQDWIFYFFIYSGFAAFCLLILYPFFFVLINSFNGELIYGPAMYWPNSFTLGNYGMVLRDQSIVWSLILSVIRVVVGSCLAVFVDSICAFSLRKRNLRYRPFYLALFMIPMFFQGGLIPVYLNLKRLALLDTFWVFIFPTLFSFFYVIILMTYFNDIPDSIEDSAFIDGAGYFAIYRRIYLPMSVPVIVTIFLFVGVSHWQTWFDSLYFTRKDSLQTFAAFLMKIVRRFSNLDVDARDMDEDTIFLMANLQGTRFTAMIISILPVLMIYPFIQKYFVKGIKLGAIKE